MLTDIVSVLICEFTNKNTKKLTECYKKILTFITNKCTIDVDGKGDNNMREISLFIDESGNLGTGMGRFFLICALEIDTNIQKSISRRSGRVINRFKNKYGISKNREIKGWKLTESQRTEILNEILAKDIKVRYIVMDIQKTTMLLKKADDKNACFNYLIQLLVKRVIEDYPNINKINLYLDNRSVKIGNRLSLKPYLYNKLVLERLEKKNELKRIEFNVNYLESESCYLIQWADIVANSIYKKYNSDDIIFYNQIKPHITFEGKFPSKNFGK